MLGFGVEGFGLERLSACFGGAWGGGFLVQDSRAHGLINVYKIIIVYHHHDHHHHHHDPRHYH